MLWHGGPSQEHATDGRQDMGAMQASRTMPDARIICNYVLLCCSAPRLSAMPVQQLAPTLLLWRSSWMMQAGVDGKGRATADAQPVSGEDSGRRDARADI